MYAHQLSYSQELPPNVLKNGVPFGDKQVASSPMRLLSISGASNKKFIVLYPDGETVKAREIVNYDKENVKDNDLWQFIQVNWTGGNYVCLRHCITGNFLCVPPNSDEPKCVSYESYHSDRYVWNVQERTIFFAPSEQKYYCYSQDSNTGVLTRLPDMTIAESKNLKNGQQINNSIPVDGKPYIRIQSDNTTVKMSYVSSSNKYYSDNLPIFHPFWSTTAWNVGKGINDPENEWYFLIQRGIELERLNLPPTSQPMGLKMLKHWSPGKRAADKYNRCNIPLKERFVDSKTQTKPAQLTPPKTMFGFTTGAQEKYTGIKGNGFRENFEYWQYLDTAMIIAYLSGWPPVELKMLKVPTGLGLEDVSGNTLFDILEGFSALQGGGIFASPNKSYIEAAHKNGCKVYSVLFFQQNVFGGKWKWWSDFLKDRDIYAKKLVDYAEYFGIDGFFVNFEAEYGGPIKDTPGTNCNMYKTGTCDEGDCKGYWCNYTIGGVDNCTGNTCSTGTFTSDGNFGYDGEDINKVYYIDFLKKLRAYREKKGVRCEICAYSSIGPGGDSHNYVSGITKYFEDIWYDPVTKEPVVDAMLSMPPGGQNDPKDVNYTYSHSREAVEGCATATVEKYDSSDNAGWPVNTGPKASSIPLSSDLSCGQKGNSCDIPVEQRKPGCDGNDKDKDSCENAGCCWKENDNPDKYPFCYVKGGDVICPDGDWTSCGGVDSSQGKIPRKRFLDYYLGTTAEKGFGDPNMPNAWTYGYTPLDSPEPWDKYIYCGNFANCNNYEKAITQPMSSFFLWQANLSQGNMGANLGRDYKLNTQLYQSLYAGKNGLVTHNLGSEPYTNVKEMGISNYVPEKSVLDSLPFHTSFCLGNGANFYINGEPQLYFGSWHDGIQDYLPTWRWWPRQTTNKDQDGAYIESKILSMDYSRSFNGGSCLRIQSIAGAGNTDFHLFKTKFVTSDGNLILRVTASSSHHTSNHNNIKIGYTLGSQGNLIDNPPIHYFEFPHLKDHWKTYEFLIPYKADDYISSICIFAPKADLHTCDAFIGDITITPQNYYNYNNLTYIDRVSTYTTSNGITNYDLRWKQIPNVLYYNVFCGEKYVGRVYGSGCEKVNHKYIHYNVANLPRNNNTFWVESVGVDGVKNGIKPFGPAFKIIVNILLILLIGYLVYVIYNTKNTSDNNKLLRYGIMVGLSFVIIVLAIHLISMRFDINLAYQPGNSGELTSESGITIENWPHCKKKAFNINFDDNRPKTWTWLLEHLKNKNIPVKVTFFINTLWLNRDLDKYKQWMKDYDVDYGAHGHWHMNHGSDNMPTASPEYCKDEKSPDPKCCDKDGKPTPARPVTDQELANNDSSCAELIRKYIYNDMKKDLVFAYPYGALPFNDDGSPKTITLDTIKKNFVAARHVTWGQVLQYPVASDPSSLLGGCADYQGQPAGCDNPAGGCSMSSCSPNVLQTIYDNDIVKYSEPQYSWPGGIDLNLDPSCENCSIIRQMDIRKNSLISLLESEKPYCIMIWGHDFHPTDKDGKTYPCDATTTLGGCADGDTSCQNNARAMAADTGVDAWLSKGDYKCPTDIAIADESCAQACVRGKVNDGVCTDNNVFYNACAEPTGYYQAQTYLPKDHPNDCAACADSCWNPSIGHKLLEMFELVKDRDDLWFGHFVEIVQYLFNRKFSKLAFVSSDGNTAKYSLTTTNVMKDYPLTISFPQRIYGSIKIDGKSQKLYYSDYARKNYVLFTPQSNMIHTIDVVFN